MKRILVATALAALVLTVAPAPITAQENWRPGMQRAEDWAKPRQGTVYIAVVNPGGKMFGYRKDVRVPCASTIKAMFMAAYLRRIKDRALNDDDRALLAPMIKRSDNDSATRIADMLGPRPINRLARDANMRNFHYTRPWGLSEVTAADQARFFFRYERYVPNRHENYARYLLSHVVSSQRWGIGRVDTPGYKKFFKGGWGDGSGWVDHQVAWIEKRNGTRIAAAVMTRDNPSHDYGKQTLRGTFRRLLRNLP